jgi:hypothetical protein
MLLSSSSVLVSISVSSLSPEHAGVHLSLEVWGELSDPPGVGLLAGELHQRPQDGRRRDLPAFVVAEIATESEGCLRSMRSWGRQLVWQCTTEAFAAATRVEQCPHSVPDNTRSDTPTPCAVVGDTT